MGMFDYVKSLHPLVEDLEYQTKDFDCGLDTIYITSGGRAVLKRSKWEPYDDTEDSKEPVKYEDMCLDGDFEFYTYSKVLKTGWVDGQLIEWYLDDRP